MSTTVPQATRTYPPGEAHPTVHKRRPGGGVTRRPRSQTRSERFEGLLVFAVFAVLAFVLGYHVITVNRVVVFDNINRLEQAYLVLWDVPAKLAALGFSNPPMPSLLTVPFAVIKPLATSLVSMAIFSSLFFGGMMLFIDRLLARCEMSLIWRLPVLVLFAASPLMAFYGSNGSSDIVYMFFLAVGLYCFVSWYHGYETIYLIGAGSAMSLAMLSRYGLIAVTVVLAFVAAAALSRRDADHDEIEGSVVAYLAPVVYAFGLWTFLNFLITGSLFGWLGVPASTHAVNATGVGTTAAYSFGSVVTHVLQVLLVASPLVIAALPLLILAGLAHRDGFSFWLVGLLILMVILVGGEAVRAGNVGQVVLKNGLPVELTALAALAWVYATAGGALRLISYCVTLALLVLALPLSWHGMLSYPYQNMEQAFIHALRNPGKNLTGTSSRGGYTVGLKSELAMADYIKRVVGEQNHEILTDNSQTFAVVLLNGQPRVFVDRSQHGDGPWKKILESPYGKVKYMLINTQSPSDEIRQRYPTAATGGNPSFRPVFTTARYVLVAVAFRAPNSKTTTHTSAHRAGPGPGRGTDSHAVAAGWVVGHLDHNHHGDYDYDDL